MSIGLGIGNVTKVGCRLLINPHDLTQTELKEQGLIWVQRVLKRADGLQATPVP